MKKTVLDLSRRLSFIIILVFSSPYLKADGQHIFANDAINPLILADVSSQGTTAMSQFSTEQCYRENFPLALGLSNNMIPQEVKFYCVAPWDFEVFQKVHKALEKSHFDAVESIVRTVPIYKQEILRQTLNLALEGAKQGPKGMEATWYVYHYLPFLHAIHAKTSDFDLVNKSFQPVDIAALTTAAASIEWEQRALKTNEKTSLESIVNKDVRLSDIPKVILSKL